MTLAKKVLIYSCPFFSIDNDKQWIKQSSAWNGHLTNIIIQMGIIRLDSMLARGRVWEAGAYSIQITNRLSR